MAGRPKGARDSAYEEKRRALIDALTSACLADPHERLSVRQMASACDVTAPTLNHYFGDRSGIVHAVLEQAWRNAAEFIEQSRQPAASLRAWVERELGQFLLAFEQFGLDRLNAWGLNEGLADRAAGPAYLRFFLEPTLQAAEEGLAHYQERGEIDSGVELRYAALTLYAPCLLLFLHQKGLGGETERPADIPDFLEVHGERFMAYVSPGDR